VANACIRLLDDPDVAIAMGANGFDKVNKNYNWQVIGNQLVSIYHQLR
jgi:glycosyltransferase involved in cell wall biosynthesis